MRKRAALLVVLLLLVGLFDVRAQSQGLCTPGTFWRHSVGRLLHTRMLSLPLKLQPQFGRDTPPHLGGGIPETTPPFPRLSAIPPLEVPVPPCPPKTERFSRRRRGTCWRRCTTSWKTLLAGVPAETPEKPSQVSDREPLTSPFGQSL